MFTMYCLEKKIQGINEQIREKEKDKKKISNTLEGNNFRFTEPNENDSRCLENIKNLF